MNNKKNNKGFSLVELIVVVAIMAVLVGVLAPAYLRYVEKSRVQKDVSAVSEVVSAAKIAAAEENVYKNMADPSTIAISKTGEITVGGAKTGDLYTAITATVGTSINLSSDAATATDAAAISISVDKDGGSVTVTVSGPTEFTSIK